MLSRGTIKVNKPCHLPRVVVSNSAKPSPISVPNPKYSRHPTHTRMTAAACVWFPRFFLPSLPPLLLPSVSPAIYY